MKKIIIIILGLMFLSGCAAKPMQFRCNSGQTEMEYLSAVRECESVVGEKPEPGYCLFGPAIIVLPIIAGVETYRAVKRHDRRAEFQECMRHKGFTCIENCATTP